MIADGWRPAVVALACAVCLIAGAAPSLPGDAGEYLVMALNFANFHGPAIDDADAPALARESAANDARLANWDVVSSTFESPRGGRDFPHFWLYPLLAAPGVWITRFFGIAPSYAFAMLNVALLVTALVVARRKIGGAAALLLFAGPILWWIDKPHSEPFTFALIAIALTTLHDRPWWALVAAGAAGSQNLPVAVFAGLVGVATLVHDRRLLRDRRWWFGAAAGAALVALHPLYMLVRHGLPTLQVHATTAGMPGWAQMSAAIFDPNIGLVANFPAFAVVVAAASVLVLTRSPRTLLAIDVVAVLLAAIVFTIAFGKAGNLHHGATPNVSRYALWYIPLALPLLARMTTIGGPRWRRAIWAIAVVSAIGNAFAFHPRWGENSREPTWAANYLWTRHPAWQNPLPEIFIETLVRIEANHVPAWTPGCEKILVAGRGDVGVWPIPCYPEPMPAECQVVNAFCYANRSNGSYSFVPAPGGPAGAALLRREVVWPKEAEPHVRSLFNQWDWKTLRPNHESARTTLRQIQSVRVTSLGSHDRVVYVLQSPQDGAALYFRLPRRATGTLVDLRTGAVIRDLVYDGAAHAMWQVPIPADRDLQLLALRIDPAP